MPDLLVALADKYGTVVSDNTLGKVSIAIDENSNTEKTYPPVLTGILERQAIGGVFNLSGITFTSKPGANFSKFLNLY